MKNIINKKDIGRRATLRNVKVFRAKDPLDYLLFVILDVREKEVIITDRADRAFIVSIKDIVLL